MVFCTKAQKKQKTDNLMNLTNLIVIIFNSLGLEHAFKLDNSNEPVGCPYLQIIFIQGWVIIRIVIY